MSARYGTPTLWRSLLLCSDSHCSEPLGNIQQTILFSTKAFWLLAAHRYKTSWLIHKGRGLLAVPCGCIVLGHEGHIAHLEGISNGWPQITKVLQPRVSGRMFFSVFQRPAVKRAPFKIAKKKQRKILIFWSPGTRKIQDYNIWSIRNVLPNHLAFPNIWLVLLNPNRSRLENDHPKHTIIINYHQSSSQIPVYTLHSFKRNCTNSNSHHFQHFWSIFEVRREGIEPQVRSTVQEIQGLLHQLERNFSVYINHVWFII